jgi:hypothetical protein
MGYISPGLFCIPELVYFCQKFLDSGLLLATALTTSGLYSSMGITYYFHYSKRWLNIQHISISKAIKPPKTILKCA